MSDSKLEDNSKSYLVLSIDGGGFRGLACLLILGHFMSQISADDEEEPPKPCQVFDLICGTSTGGLIAILLGRFGLSCEEAIQVYREVGEMMFSGETDSQKLWEHIIAKGHLSSAMFETKLEHLVAKYTGNKDALFNPPKSAPDTVSHDSTKTFISLVPKIGSAGVDAHRIRSYARPLRGVDPTPFGHKWTLFEGARGTCATPLYLSPLKIPIGASTFIYQDAGYSGFNNLAKAAVNEAEQLFGADAAITLFSLGTGLRSLVDDGQQGTGANKNSKEEYVDNIARQMVKNLVETGKDTPDALDVAKRVAKQLLEVANDTEIAHLHMYEQFKRQRRQKHYYRFNPDRGLGDIDLTDFREDYPIQSVTNAWLIKPDEQVALSSATDIIKEHYERKKAPSGSRAPEMPKVTSPHSVALVGSDGAPPAYQEQQPHSSTAGVASHTLSNGGASSLPSASAETSPPVDMSDSSPQTQPPEIHVVPAPPIPQGLLLVNEDSNPGTQDAPDAGGPSKSHGHTETRGRGRWSAFMKRLNCFGHHIEVEQVQ